MTIETSQVTAAFAIQMRRYKDFAGIRIYAPMEVRHWIMNTNTKRDGVEQWIVPLSVLALGTCPIELRSPNFFSATKNRLSLEFARA